MDGTKSALPKRLDRCDAALLAAFVLVAVLGTWQSCLMVIDGAVFLIAAWMGDAWDLFFNQVAGRTVSAFVQFGPAWALRALFEPSPTLFMIAGHAFYFAGPLVLWLILRAVEPERIYSRLYLAIVLVLIYFISEMLAGIGLWMIWLAVLADPARSRRARVLATVLITPAIVFTHPAVAVLSLTFALVGSALILCKRPFPHHLAVAAAAMGLLLVAAYVVTTSALAPSNPTVAAQHSAAQYDYIDPVWMLATLGLFPMLAVLWLLMLAPGLEGAAMRWRLSPVATMAAGAIGLWFAFNGTNSLT